MEPLYRFSFRMVMITSVYPSLVGGKYKSQYNAEGLPSHGVRLFKGMKMVGGYEPQIFTCMA